MTEKYVYAISDGKSIKIGVAQHPLKRLKTLTTGNASKLILLGFFSGGFQLEKEIHNRFRKIRSNGEWMMPTQDLIDYLNAMITDKHIIVENDCVKAYLKTSI